MKSPALAELTRRLESLERDARRWRAAALTLGAALGLAVAVAAAPQAKPRPADQAGRVIEARKVVLKDDKGQTRVILSAGEAAGGASLMLFGPTKKDKATLAVPPTEEPALDLAQDQGHATLGVIHGQGDFELTDAKGKPVFRAPGMARLGSRMVGPPR